jgi:hypothetical protein
LATYSPKRPTIQAVKLDAPVDLPDGTHGNVGDWLITTPDGGQVVLSDDKFTARFELVQ